jgi:hypothetical protein
MKHKSLARQRTNYDTYRFKALGSFDRDSSS